MDHKQIGEVGNRYTEVVIEATAPLLLEADAATPLGVEAQHSAADGVEARCHHDHIERMVAGLSPYTC